MKASVFAAVLGVVLFCLAIVSLANPTLCSSGCGNLMEFVFQSAYRFFGPWGVRAVLLVLAFCFFLVAARAARAGE